MYEKVLMSSNQHYAAQVGYLRIPQSAELYSKFSLIKSWIHHSRHIF